MTKTYTVTDPAGVTVTRRSSKDLTHALIRRNKGSDRYFVNFASSLDKAERESRVLADSRDYVAIVPVVGK